MTQKRSKGKVLIAMSGGLDSSVSAALLQKQGYDCIGVYMNLWTDPTIFSLEDRKKFPQNKCCSLESLMVARSVCQKLSIPFYSVNFEESFKNNVVDKFLEGFHEGETPNPCVRCNKTIKFGILFEKMKELGCDYLATGHYAKLVTDKNGLIHLHRGKDKAKDQTYFLYNLTQEKLKKIIFPVADYDKNEVRKIAKKFGLNEVEKKRESQGVCFYPEKTYFEFLKRTFEAGKDFKSGKIKNTDGKIVGEHQGLPFYTIGQRKGIGVGGGPALYVNKMDFLRNSLIVGNENELLSSEVTMRDANFLSGKEPKEDEIFDIRIRSQGHFSKAKIQKIGNNKKSNKKYLIKFLAPEKAIMPGQSAVLYRGTELVGGGIMCYN